MRYVIPLLLSFCVFTAQAQTGQKKHLTRPEATTSQQTKRWTKEPEAFLGIKLGQPLNIPVCPVTQPQGSFRQVLDLEALKGIDGVCIDSTEIPIGGTHAIGNVPNLAFRYDTSATVKDGVVSMVSIDMNQAFFTILLDVFVERYGSPTSVKSNKLKTRAGAEFNASEVIWTGQKMSIRMVERFGRVDKSFVMVTDNAIAQAEADAQASKASAEGKKF